MSKLQRYEWEDALITAEVEGRLGSGPVNTGLRLAKAINWVPKDHRVSGLYWANEEAADSVGISRASLYRNIKVLKAAGFFIESKGNLLPVIPESRSETLESRSETGKSHNETRKSQSDNPYTVDSYTVDSLSEEIYTEGVSGEPPVSLALNKDGVSLPLVPSPVGATGALPSFREEVPKSHFETATVRYGEYLEQLGGRDQINAFYEGVNKKRMRPQDAVDYAKQATAFDEW